MEFINKIFNFLAILGLLGFCITLWWDNRKNGVELDPKIIAVLLIATVFIYARKGILSSLLKIVIAIFGLGYTMVKINLFSMSQFYQTAGSLLALIIALFGFYVMFGGLNKNNDEVHFSVNRKTGKLKRKWL